MKHLLVAQRRARRRRPSAVAAERQYLAQKIGFGTDTGVGIVGTGPGARAVITRSDYPWRGELQTRLTPKQFYELVERPDLYAAYQTRRGSPYAAQGGGGMFVAGRF